MKCLMRMFAEEDKGAPGTELAAGESEAAERRGVLVRMIDDSLDDLPRQIGERGESSGRVGGDSVVGNGELDP